MRKIEFEIGQDLGDAFVVLIREEMKTHDIVWGVFNGQPVFSDDNIDEAYLRVTGNPYLELQDEINFAKNNCNLDGFNQIKEEIMLDKNRHDKENLIKAYGQPAMKKRKAKK